MFSNIQQDKFAKGLKADTLLQTIDSEFQFQVQEKVIDYTNCNGCNNIINGKQNYGKTCKCVKEFRLDKKFSGPVYLYYGLSNFYQVVIILLNFFEW